MDIKTEDSLHISQKPYNLSLKHTTWVQKELKTLEKVGFIVQSVLPLASPIMVVQNNLNLENPHGEGSVDY